MGLPTLETIACSATNASNFKVLGQTHDGALVAQGTDGYTTYSTGLYALDGSGPRAIAEGDKVTPILDHTFDVPRLRGWFVNRGGSSHVCLDEQPRRCWNTPSNAELLDVRFEPGIAHPFVSLLFHDVVGTTHRFTVVRSFGLGEPLLP